MGAVHYNELFLNVLVPLMICVDSGTTLVRMCRTFREGKALDQPCMVRCHGFPLLIGNLAIFHMVELRQFQRGMFYHMIWNTTSKFLPLVATSTQLMTSHYPPLE